MRIDQDYVDYLARQKKYFNKPVSHYWAEQERRYVEPFRIFGNVYYVGDSWVCVHLIDTGDGLLLIDAGNVGAAAMLVHAIWSLGFDPADVKWIILSHGHLDHIGAANFFRRMFGTRIYMGAPDAEMFENRPALCILQDNPDISESLCPIDVKIQDGDVITFGNVTVNCRLVPGHTEGCVALFFDVTENGVTRRAGYYGGFGLNTLQTEFLHDIGDFSCQARKTYLKSLASVRNEHVDLFLGNHTSNNKTLEKRDLLKKGEGENPFIDPTAWAAYLDDRASACSMLMQEEAHMKK